MAKKRRTTAGKRKKTGAGGNFNNWIWLLGGLLMGLTIGLGVYFYRLPVETTASAPPVERTKQKAPGRSSAATTTTGEHRKSRFDFYTLLPKIEMEITGEELDRALRIAPRHQDHNRYILQVASFRRYQEADKLKARLALLGLVAKIEPITNRSGTTWHRVRLGPFQDVHSFKKARRKLQKNHIDYMVVKIRG